MVLRTTEYRLQFNALTNVSRKQIWLENLATRGLLRSTNQADHYWAHQLNEETDEDAVPAVANVFTPNRFLPNENITAKEKQIKERDTTLDQAVSETHRLQLDSQLSVVREVAVQTPYWEEEFPQQYDSSQELRHLANNLSLTSVNGNDHLDKCIEIPPRPLTPVPPPSPLTVGDLIHNTRPPSHVNQQSAHPSDGSKSSLHMLTRTSRNNFFEKRTPPFESFGWNDLKKNMGDKKTHSVYAPKKEVYEHALDTWNRRRKEIDQYLAEEAERKNKALRGACSNVSNHSSIWMTEYEDSFSTKRKNKVLFNERMIRPTTAESIRRPLWWKRAVY